jgi:hypothetical protein
VKPVYKKGDIHDVQNYRPISFLLISSKRLEKLMYNRLISIVIQTYQWRPKMVSGRRNQPQQELGLSLTKAIHSCLHQFQYCLTKAYLVINQNILLNKLNSYGISGITNLWFKSNLAY